MRSIFQLLLLSFVVVSTSCEKKNETKISNYSGIESHKMGQNCMNCHIKGGGGQGWFNVAGTVYDTTMQTTYPNATIKLYTDFGGNGTLKYTVKVDGRGNFYTTENIDFGSGLFPVVEGSNETHYMSSKITTGTCNSCHGVSTGVIWTK